MLPDKYTKFVQIMKNYCRGYDEETGGKNYRMYHQLRVAQTVYWLDPTAHHAIIAALFHDVGRIAILKKNSKKILMYADKEEQRDHEFTSVEVITEILKDLLTIEEFDIVGNIILGADSPDTKVFQDADNLDELGAQGIGRLFAYSEHIGRDLEDTVDYWFNTDRLKKLDKVPDYHSAVASKEALRRINLQDDLLDQLRNAGFEEVSNGE